MISIQKIKFPDDCKVIKNEFFDYDPINEYNEEYNLKYLDEDLLQCTFPEDDITIDLGWYGDVTSNNGEFKIYIIKNENWEIPLNIINSKSVKEIKNLLNKIIQYYSRV